VRRDGEEQDREHRREQSNRRAPHPADATVAPPRSMQAPTRLVLAGAQPAKALGCADLVGQ
jgi:hypothetical protein